MNTNLKVPSEAFLAGYHDTTVHLTIMAEQDSVAQQMAEVCMQSGTATAFVILLRLAKKLGLSELFVEKLRLL